MTSSSPSASADALELERLLRAYPAVRDVHVDQTEAGEGTHLVAYVLRLRADERKIALQENVWKTVFDDTFHYDDAAENLNSSMWVSSYTGGAIDPSEMADWANATVARILALAPKRVLEIGCGDGQLLLKIAPHCEHYEGTDLSEAAIAIVTRRAAEQGLSSVARLSCRSGSDFSGFEPGAFDAVVINSVAQYFPSLDYLFGVLERAKRVLVPGGAVFLGDLRNLRWAKLFYLSTELHQAAAELTPAQLREKMSKRVDSEKELLLDPSIAWTFIERLGFASARAEMKTSRHENELVRFRYDLTLTTPRAAEECEAPTEPPGWVDWETVADLSALKSRLATASHALAVRGIPNARLAGLSRALRKLRASDATPTSLEELRAAAAGSAGIAPQDLFDLAAELGFRLRLGPSPILDACDAVFDRDADPALETTSGVWPKRSALDCVTDPMNRGAARFGKKMAADLGEKAPRLARAATILVVERLPRDANGAIDRAALLDELV